MALGSKAGCKPSRKASSRFSSNTDRLRLSSRLGNVVGSSGKGSISGSSSSRRVQHNYSSVSTSSTRYTSKKETLTSNEIQIRAVSDHLAYKERMDTMTTTELSNLATLYSDTMTHDEDDNHQPAIDILDILSGQNAMDISHVGGEFADLLAIGDDLLGPVSWYVLILCLYICKVLIMSNSRPKVRDYRTRRNRTQRRTDAFAHQLPSLVHAYMNWMLAMGEGGLSGEYTLPLDAEIQSESQIKVIDILGQ